MFWHLTPNKLKAFEKAYELQRKIDDEKAYMQGIYTLKALEVSLSHLAAGFANKKSDAKYFDKPLFQIDTLDNDNVECNEQIAVYEMKQRIKILEKQGLKPSPK